jgi:hypothetical protein
MVWCVIALEQVLVLGLSWFESVTDRAKALKCPKTSTCPSIKKCWIADPLLAKSETWQMDVTAGFITLDILL